MLGKIILTIFIIIAVIGGGFILAAKSADAAAPGDALYALDRAYESIQRLFTTADNKADFEVAVLEERVGELEKLQAADAALQNIEKAVGYIGEQEDRAAVRVREAEDNTNSDAGTLERVRERLETQQATSLQLMQKIQVKYQTQQKAMIQTEEQVQEQNRVMDQIDFYQEQIQNRKQVNSQQDTNGNNSTAPGQN